MIVHLLGDALDALTDYVETHDWAALLIMAALALMVCTADGWW